MTGKVLGHYRILEKLGEGGMGVVYKAEDLHLDRFVALKVLPPEELTDPERRQRFAQEAKAASSLNHPNIVTIHDVSSDGGVDFIAMEYVQGKTLDQLIPSKGMRINDALKIAVQVADALAAAHAIGVVHRDVKPSNVMVGDQGRVKVLDFGLAKLKGLVGESGSETAATAPRTEAGRIVGTLHYMSPEQAQGRRVDERSDIFSFGSMLHEMVSGQRPFRGQSAVTILAAIIEKEAPPLPAEIPADVQKVVARCLRKEPSRRFQHMADVGVELQELREESDPNQTPLPARAGTFRWRRWIAAGGVSALVLAAAAWFLMSGGARTLPPASLVQLTSYPGTEDAPALSPDGKQVAFSWNGEKEDNYDIYVQFVGDTSASRLTTDPGEDRSPCWSPDGRRLAFRRRGSPGSSIIVLVSPLGGPEQRLGEVPGLPPANTGMSWSPDGRFLAVGRGTTPRSALEAPSAPGTYLVPLSGGEPRRITSPQPPEVDRFPQFSPDGTRLAFVRSNLALSTGDIYVQPLGSDYEPAGAPQRLTRDRAMRGRITWTPDGKTLVFSAMVGSLTRLYRMPVEGDQPPERIELAGHGATFPTISAHRLAFSRSLMDTDIWRFRAESGSEPLIRSSFTEWAPRFSPDGQKVAFSSNRNGNSGEVWVADADGSNPRQLTRGPGLNQGSPRWSADGRQLAFDSQGPDGSFDIYTIDSTGGQPRRLTSSPSSEFQPSWSRDGRWIYFQSDRAGRLQIWRCPFPGGAADQWQQMTTGGGEVAFESSDGKTLFYTELAMSQGDRALYARPLAGTTEPKLIEKATRGFAVVEEGIFYLGTAGKDGKLPLRFYDLKSGARRELTKLASSGELTASPDGKSVLYTASLYSGKDLMLIENFR
jgi:eukaryotic-like serine/threonine-protein kinase